jgi:PhzF family phenazine biosynthesis protein
MPDAMDIQRLAAFSDGDHGGNPAGVVVADALPPAVDMQRIAAEVGDSETAFAAWQGNGWRVRYFSPAAEVPFCGHATIALGAALALREGDGTFELQLNDVAITVDGRRDGEGCAAALMSPPTRSAAASGEERRAVLDLFGLVEADLDPRIPPACIHAGADHFALMLKDRATLAAMRYDFAAGRALMRATGWVTILLGHVDSPRRFSTRNAFAYGGVYEDPATGASSAALAGYLRDLGWPHGGAIDVHQGDDMGAPSRIHAVIADAPGSAIRVSGSVRTL